MVDSPAAAVAQQPALTQTTPATQEPSAPVSAATTAVIDPEETVRVPKFCPSCGDPVHEGEKYCSNCGTSLTAG